MATARLYGLDGRAQRAFEDAARPATTGGIPIATTGGIPTATTGGIPRFTRARKYQICCVVVKRTRPAWRHRVDLGLINPPIRRRNRICAPHSYLNPPDARNRVIFAAQLEPQFLDVELLRPLLIGHRNGNYLHLLNRHRCHLTRRPFTPRTSILATLSSLSRSRFSRSAQGRIGTQRSVLLRAGCNAGDSVSSRYRLLTSARTSGHAPGPAFRSAPRPNIRVHALPDRLRLRRTRARSTDPPWGAGPAPPRLRWFPPR